MKQAQKTITVRGAGLVTVFCGHTLASLTIQETADPDVRHDPERFFADQVPDDAARYRHASEGADDMPAHIQGALADVSLGIPGRGGRIGLGTWQGITLFEQRSRGHRRRLVLHVSGAP